MSSSRTLASPTLLGLLAACSTTDKPQPGRPKTGLHATTASVDAGGVITGKASVRLADFGAVLLVARSNQYPLRHPSNRYPTP